ncbi:MAG: RIO-type serine/threonine-protein kinase Rio1 [Promethearchaeota archaeon]|nr:MAG: RIO-type serine/threonine-protein kinase Rio1 [Candidatus Lokiarchaeota archaeon]
MKKDEENEEFYELSSHVDNLIKKKIDTKRIREVDRSKKTAAFESVLDERTITQLQKILDKGILNDIEGIISAGKEANVYLGYVQNSHEVAIKIYKIDSNTSRWMKNYIIGDPRFKKVPKNIAKIIYLWASKEYKNLKRAQRAGLRVPKPIYVRDNILIMEYIGFGSIPAPKLKDIVNPINKEFLLNDILDFIKNLYQKSKLVHGDLSEFNILYHNQKPFYIDISQAVSIEHPKSEKYLVRDIKNVFRYFEKYNMALPNPEDFYYETIEV